MFIRGLAIFVAFFTVTADLAIAPSFASPPESASRVVSHADLDLSTAAGVKALHRRVASALEAVCGSYAGTENSAGVEERDEITKCRATARAQMNQRLDVTRVASAK